MDCSQKVEAIAKMKKEDGIEKIKEYETGSVVRISYYKTFVHSLL